MTSHNIIKSSEDSYDDRVWVEDMVPGYHRNGSKFVVMLPAACLPQTD